MENSTVIPAEAIVNNDPAQSPQSRLCVKSKGRLVFLKQHSISWLESAGNYVQIKLGGEPAGEYVVRGTLQSFEDLLDERYFVRIHRSVIVNCRRIRELRPWYTGEYIVTLDNGKELTMSRRYRASLSRLVRMSTAA